VPPGFVGPVRARALGVVVAGAVLVGLAGACSPAAFDPTEPCRADGRAAGAYPELEAVVSETFRGRAADRLDSGRNCTPQALASLTLHGITELRFAGATWDLGSSNGVTLAVFDAKDLNATWVAEFFETGARTAKKTTNVEARTVPIPDGGSGSRIDVLNDESYQTVVVWPDGSRVRVALIASSIRDVQTKAAHDAVVTEALAAAIAR
jgi:hypothetical protein